MLDRYGRNINYLRVSLTDRCNLRCIYCMPEKGIKKLDHNDIMRFDEIIKVINAASDFGIKKIRYTGGEPLIQKGIDKLIFDTANVKGIEDISITTNGIYLSEMAEDLKKAGLNRVNISLDTLKKDRFTKITRGGNIDKVFKAIEKSISLKLSPVKINVVIIKGINDDEINDFVNLTKTLPIEVRFIELMPLGEGVKYYKNMMTSEEVIDRISDFKVLKESKSGVARVLKLENFKGSIGFISPLSCKFCSECNKIRLTSIGKIKPCLHSTREIDLKKYINNEEILRFLLKKSIREKPHHHYLEHEKVSRCKRMMFEIGG